MYRTNRGTGRILRTMAFLLTATVAAACSDDPAGPSDATHSSAEESALDGSDAVFATDGELADWTISDAEAESTADHDLSDARSHGLDRVSYARFAVARARAGIRTAERILAAGDPVRRQHLLLRQAKTLARAAATALEHGAYRRAVVNAQKSIRTSLLAIILPDVTREEVRQVAASSSALLEAARAGVNTPFERRAYARALQAFETGRRLVANGNPRGVVSIWNAGVTAAVLAPGSS